MTVPTWMVYDSSMTMIKCMNFTWTAISYRFGLHISCSGHTLFDAFPILWMHEYSMAMNNVTNTFHTNNMYVKQL